MSKLLDDVTSGKRAYQCFVIEHGIEKISIKIPIKESRVFENSFKDAARSGASKSSLLQLVEQHGGSIQTAKKA